MHYTYPCNAYNRKQNYSSTPCPKNSYLMQFFGINICQVTIFTLFITSMRWYKLAIKPQRNLKHYSMCSKKFSADCQYHVWLLCKDSAVNVIGKKTTYPTFSYPALSGRKFYKQQYIHAIIIFYFFMHTHKENIASFLK